MAENICREVIFYIREMRTLKNSGRKTPLCSFVLSIFPDLYPKSTISFAIQYIFDGNFPRNKIHLHLSHYLHFFFRIPYSPQFLYFMYSLSSVFLLLKFTLYYLLFYIQSAGGRRKKSSQV